MIKCIYLAGSLFVFNQDNEAVNLSTAQVIYPKEDSMVIRARDHIITFRNVLKESEIDELLIRCENEASKLVLESIE